MVPRGVTSDGPCIVHLSSMVPNLKHGKHAFVVFLAIRVRHLVDVATTVSIYYELVDKKSDEGAVVE